MARKLRIQISQRDVSRVQQCQSADQHDQRRRVLLDLSICTGFVTPRPAAAEVRRPGQSLYMELVAVSYGKGTLRA